MPGFLTDDFYLYDPADQTKQLKFDTSALSTSSLVSLVAPGFSPGALSRTIAAVDQPNQQFTGGNSFSNSVDAAAITLHRLGSGYTADLFRTEDHVGAPIGFRLDYKGHIPDTVAMFSSGSDATKLLGLDLSGLTTSTSRSWTAQDASGTVALIDVAQTWGVAQTFKDTAIKVGDDGDITKAFQWSLGGAITGKTLTLASSHTVDRTVTMPDADGTLAINRASVNLTAQTAAIGSTTLTSGAGYYVVHYTLETTTADAAAGTIQFQINYTDDIGATNQTGAALALTAVGRDRGSFQVYLASGNITYQTNLVGAIGTSQYALRVRCEYLG